MSQQISKEQQEKLLIEIMEADEKDGLYKQRTAVTWLITELIQNRLMALRYDKDSVFNEIIQKAKQMEKEQIEDAHIEGQRVFDKHPHTQWNNDQAEQYYNETYGK